MSTYLITGGAGFIGTNLSERLVHEGHRVVIVDDLRAGTDPARLPKEATLHKFDICDTTKLTSCMKNEGVDVVVHLAALPSVQFSIDHPFEAQHINIDGTLSVLEAVREAGVRRVVYAASSAAYGDQETLPLSESLPAQPKSPYALHKYTGEHLMRMWHIIHGIQTISLRFFNVYGPHFDPKGAYALVMGKFMRQRSEGVSMTITGDGEQTRDFVHVRDIADALYKASTSESVGHGEVFNVGSGRNASINEIAHMIGGPVEYIAPRIEPKHTRADITLIQKVLDWKPEVKLEDGINELKKQFGIV